MILFCATFEEKPLLGNLLQCGNLTEPVTRDFSVWFLFSYTCLRSLLLLALFYVSISIEKVTSIVIIQSIWLINSI